MTDKTTPEPVADALPPLPASQAFSLTRSVYTADDMHVYASAALASRDAEIAKLRQGEPVALTDDLVETFVTQYNDVYCDQRRAGVTGGDAECKAMREVLTLALGALTSPPPAPVQPEPVAWVPVAERMPKSGATVLACYTNRSGNVRRIRAEWVAAKTIESDGDSEICEYDEATDCCYDPEGWYEKIDNWGDYSSVVVNEGEVTHWMPLPAHPDASPPPAQPAQAERLEPCCGIPNECSGSGPCQRRADWALGVRQGSKLVAGQPPRSPVQPLSNEDIDSTWHEREPNLEPRYKVRWFARAIERLITERAGGGE